jgi:dTMP kinase
MDRAFHERLRQGFLTITEAEPKRCKLIDAGGSEAEVQARIIAAAKSQFPKHL